MAKQSGKTLYVEFDGVPLNVAYRSLTLNKTQNTADSTAGADEYVNTVATTKEVTVSLTVVAIKHADGGDDIETALSIGAEGALLIGFEGNTAGLPKFGITARVSQYNINASYDDVVTADVEFVNVGEDLLFDGVVDVF